MCRRPTTHRCGFTLMEILVASALMGFLALVTWTLFDTYRNLFESGIDRSGRTRLARAISEQFNDDLRSAIQESSVGQTVSLETSGEEGQATSSSPSQATGLTGGQATGLTGDPATGTTENSAMGMTSDSASSSSGDDETSQSESDEAATTRRFGLFGSSRTLRLDVLQVDPRHVYRLASITSLSEEQNVGSLLFEDTLDEENVSPVGKAAELRTIEYSFVAKQEDEINPQTPVEDSLSETSTSASEETKRPPRPGLTRRELSFDMVVEEDGSLLDDVGLEEIDPEEPFDPNECYLPEVIDLSFRYYDGGGWTNSWDSLTRKSLPVAVEITFKLKIDRRPRHGARNAASGSESDEVEVSEDATVGADVETDEVAYIDESYEDYQDATNPPEDEYRILLTLPTSAKYPGVRAESESSFETTPESLAPRSLQQPTLQTPRLKTQEKPKAEERWMRSNSS